MGAGQPKYSVGRDCDAWCTRCKMDLAHTVVAMASGVPVQVKCNTCGGFHKYRPTKAEREAAKEAKRAAPRRKSVSAAATRKTERARTGGTAATEVCFSQLIVELADAEPRAYNVRDAFEARQVLAHSKFGKGVVLEELPGNRIRVLFEDSERVLINRYGQ